MAGETVITIVGNLTADPETRTTQNGGTVCNFIIASTPRQYNSQSGQGGRSSVVPPLRRLA